MDYPKHFDVTVTGTDCPYRTRRRSVAGIGLIAGMFLLAGCGGGSSSSTTSLQSISFTPNPFATGVSITRQLTATGTYSDGSTQDLTASATWTSQDPTIVTVTGGSVTGVASGSTAITATVAGISANTTVDVTTDGWTAAANLPVVLGGLESVTLLANGTVLAAGGDNVNGELKNAEIL